MFPTFHFDIERWKYNPTFELWVYTRGRIRNKSTADIAPKVMRNGYMAVHVYGSLNKWMLLHRVVMLTWRPTPEAEELTVDHLDHNKRNNALSNLEWVSFEENRRRADKDVIADSEVEAAPTPVKMKTPAELWKEKMATRIGWRIEWPASYNKYEAQLVDPAVDQVLQILSKEGFSKEQIKTFSRKFSAIIYGSTQQIYIKYCGICITAVFSE
jgi:hypothetical protein